MREVKISNMTDMTKSIETAAKIVPSEKQYNWQTTEFYAFVHFGVNTFTGREWGDGTEDPAIFNPVKLDAEQWVNAVKSADMRGLILTAKHHDGFCLWSSKYTEHSVKNSPYKNGKGDIVRETAEACKKGGIKFGVYLSPWDRHEATYGSGAAYDEYYINQLTELLTQYGEIFEIWFDGACGEGPNGKKQVYDFTSYFEVCNRLQPEAVIFGGPDIRWCGNEAGDTRDAEWSVIPVKHRSVMEPDLGSREVIERVTEFKWFPCETDTSIRPGWFYHAEEDGKVRPLEELMNIYYKSVGGNSSLLLNIPPDKNGLFHENDVKRLKEIGDRIRNEFAHNYAPVDIELDMKFDDPVEVSKIVLMEDIKIGQRVETFSIYADGIKIYDGKTIGYKRIAVLENKILTDNIRIEITQSRLEPKFTFIGVY